ncbi:Fasciclin-like arabinogalactan family protein [Rhynchospora pubera]|uniref:Fasciclin-like arabinogalactan family protein n=1 Tax=Rhynchospora pubera TaxID=906938 RepID=A0AAV8HP65_9POAL|nr:Fasciclin-like arabinogalactan family protein [Rhynchospora pubera]KAJ4817857.1 Fasciclin-like arabinogalactan family protein [Rhynchospora pubera]
MAPKSLVALFFSLLIASGASFDVVKILTSESENHSTFAKLLTDTKLIDDINSRQTITVLALDNTAIGAITSLDSELQKKILSLHIILDYYDPVKLDMLNQKTILLTTLFQASGGATGQMGFLNFTQLPDQTQVFGSAVPGAPLDSTLVGVIAARPYNVSVMAVSKAIIPPGINGAATGSSPPTSSAQSPSTPSSKATSPEQPNTPPTEFTTPPSPSTPSSEATSPEQPNTPPTEFTTPPSGNATAASPAPKKSTNAPASNDTSPPTSADEDIPLTSADETTPTEAPSGNATQTPATAEGPTADTASNSSSPSPADVSESPGTGGSSNKTSSAGTLVARSGLVFVAMGLVLFGAL